MRAATDITGFGLLGHASEMATAANRLSGVGFVVHAASLPVLDGVWDYIAAGYTSAHGPAETADRLARALRGELVAS